VTRTVTHSNLSTPASRQRLKPDPKPYWQAVDPGVHLGYRRGVVGGRWAVRVYDGERLYKLRTFAIADDHVAADGERVMSYQQARKAALELASAPAPGPYSVADALSAYFARLEGKGSKSWAAYQRRAEMHIVPDLGDEPVDSLTRPMLEGWLASMVKGETPDAIRASRASANRTMTILKAALTQCYKNDQAASDRAWKTCEAFRDVNRARIRYFSRDEITRLLNAATGDFRSLCKAALFSGARYSELGRLKVSDFATDTGTLYIGESKSGNLAGFI
jgi:hypothetical protein